MPAYLLSSDRRPLYIRAAETIQTLVVNSRLVAGDRLPSEFELASMLGVGRSTIRESVGYLETAGLLRRHRGIGTVVLDHSALAVGLEALESVEALAARQGWVCRTSDVNIREDQAQVDVARRLQLHSNDRVTVISRIKTRAGAPFAEMISYVPASVLSYAVLKARFRDSITELFLHEKVSPVRRAMAEVTVVSADPTRAKRLAIKVRSPLLVLDELFLSEQGLPLAWNVLYFIPGMIRLEVMRQPRLRATGNNRLATGKPTRKAKKPSSL